MTNKDVLNFIDFWLYELLHVGHQNVEEKTKILKVIRREIMMGIDMAFVNESDEYVESGMAKLMAQRYPELKIRTMKGMTVSSDIKENGLEEIQNYIEKHPNKVTYADYLHCTKLIKYFAIRKKPMPIQIVQSQIDCKSNLFFEGEKFILKTDS